MHTTGTSSPRAQRPPHDGARLFLYVFFQDMSWPCVQVRLPEFKCVADQLIASKLAHAKMDKDLVRLENAQRKLTSDVDALTATQAELYDREAPENSACSSYLSGK